MIRIYWAGLGWTVLDRNVELFSERAIIIAVVEYNVARTVTPISPVELWWSNGQ